MSKHLVGALNTRRIGTRYVIRLRKGPNGLGIKIAGRDNMHNTKNRPIYITAITTSGSAYHGGQIKEGDMLLEVNGIDIIGKSQSEVTKMLKNVKVDEEVELVISRQEFVPDSTEINHSGLDNSNTTKNGTNDNDDSLIDLNVPEHDDSVFAESSNKEFEKRIDNILNDQTIDGPGTYTFDIPFNDTKSAGLGLYLKFPIRSSDGKDLGTWIEKVITGGAAWKDGRLQPNDEILAVNGINLIGLSKDEAVDKLNAAVSRGIGPEATPNNVRLTIQRRDPIVARLVLLATEFKNEHSVDINVFNTSSDSSNQNSQNDSVMSPQTQASSSLRLSSFNDRTNETTSSAISQITDFTSVPISDNAVTDGRETISVDRRGFAQSSSTHFEDPTPSRVNPKQTNQHVYVEKTALYKRSSLDCNTTPKSFGSETQDAIKNSIEDNASSSQSWDDESLDANRTGEEVFQRDGFGRQSISEKRHAQLSAKNTDTFKRNQKAREERERQQLARQQLENQVHDELIVPRVGNVRVARNRKVNESFRAAIDRSYEVSRNESINHQDPQFSAPIWPNTVPFDHRNIGVGLTRIESSIANSTVSTANEEKHLINDRTISSNGNHQTVHKKSSSLLTKFLRFGSIKRKKKKNHDAQSQETKESTNAKSFENSNNTQFNRDTEHSIRSQSNRGSTSKSQPPQSHLSMQNSGHQRQTSQISKQTDSLTGGQLYVNNVKQTPVLHANNVSNGFDMHQQHRMPIPMCHYQQPLLNSNDTNTHYHLNQVHSMAVQPKQPYQYESLTLGRQTGTHHVNSQNHIHHNQQYSHVPFHHHQGPSLVPSPNSNQQNLSMSRAAPNSHHLGSIDLTQSHSMHFHAPEVRESRHNLNPINRQGRCSNSSNMPNQWQPQPMAPSGLWVTDTPASGDMQPPMQSLYGALAQPRTVTRQAQENNYTVPHNHQTRGIFPPVFIPQIAGPSHPQLQPTHHLNNHLQNPHYVSTPSALTNSDHQNMQPQHIYYYDF